jgi:hypothetical protein
VKVPSASGLRRDLVARPGNGQIVNPELLMLSGRGLSVFFIIFFAGMPSACAVHSQELLIGNWIQSVNGERMRIGKDGQVVFSPVLGTDEIKGTLSVGAAADGGNITIRIGGDHVCVYIEQRY